MPWITVVGILFVSLPIVWPFEQVVDPPAEHCADLEPQNLLNIPKLLGTWYGVEFVSHRNMISSQKSDFSCIVIELFELGGSETTTRRPVPPTKSTKNLNGSAIVTPVDIKTRPFDEPWTPTDHYRFLGLHFTEEEEQYEYTLRFNSSRRGFWLASPPHGQDTTAAAQDVTGTVQVIRYDDNYLLLTVCENQPRSRLFSVILSRHLHFLPLEIIRELRNDLKIRNLPTIYDRSVCNESTSAQYSLLLVICSLFIVRIHNRRSAGWRA